MDDNNNEIKIPKEVREFLEGILKDAGMTPADEAMREEMVAQLFARLDSYITSVLVDKMPPEKMEDFIKMNQEGKPKEEVEEYIKNNLPDATDVLAGAFSDFRAMYLSGVADSRNQTSEGTNTKSANEPKEEE